MKKKLQHQSSGENNYQGANEKDKILQRTSEYDVPQTLSTDEALTKLKLRIAALREPEQQKNTRGHYLYYWVTSAAAVIILLVGIWFYGFRNNETLVVAERGKHINFVLPEGSVVNINAESEILFNKRKFDNNRILKLKGEAFFSVRKGSTFIVSTPYGEVKVLGTSFNVLARENSFKVSCLSGKVKVSSGDDNVTLVPGESSIAAKNTLTKYTDKNVENNARWRNGEFYFENTTLKMVFDEIARQFNVTFVFENIDGRIFTGSFSNNSLSDALDIICIPMGLTYEIGNNSTVFIRKKAL